MKAHLTRALSIGVGIGACVLAGHGAQAAEITATDILNVLVEEGVLTEDKAKEFVERIRSRDSQAADETEGALAPTDSTVRVPYVPQSVKEEITKEVREEVLDTVASDVMLQARREGWGVKEAPSWVHKTTISGDVRVRYENVLYPDDNPDSAFFLDWNEVNNNGSTTGDRELLYYVEEDQQRLRGRARLMVAARPSDNVEVGVRLTSGNQGNPVSANQTLGRYGQKWETSFDLAYIAYQTSAETFLFEAGRFQNPWLHTDLVWDADMTFEGLSTTIAPLRSASNLPLIDPFISLGAFPIQEIHLPVLASDTQEPPNDDKWLYAAQLGTRFNFSDSSRFSFGIAYYAFDNVVGQTNAIDENNQDSTAPLFNQWGNTRFNIAVNDPIGGSQRELYALASEFELFNVTMKYEYTGFENYRLELVADGVKNLGFDADEIAERKGDPFFPDRDTGYQFNLGFGTKTLTKWGDWKAGFTYRYLEGDAVIDAFADSDFLLGGTGSEGYILEGDWVLKDNLWLKLRWISAEEIDASDVFQGPPGQSQLIFSDLEVDTIQLDLNAKF